MAITVGDKLPDATMLVMGDAGPEEVRLSSVTSGRKVALFGLPGAYTGTCTTAHVPSFIRSMETLKEKGVEEVICTAVNDPFVMKAWGADTGATEAGITMLADSSGEFAKAMGLDFTAEGAGFYGRSRRYALFAEDGEIKVLNVEESPGVCDMSGGETLADAI
ncbi:peroxiredoxin [Histidinibacterium aquaticum]|uniref:Glutathione-dependent peroxiredoxin n=1 Tax=Histidinibacterium aquaticum TaxID=2613962 RepID=A0A5J5GFZ2_9RHOB|nr:peroxiredoxin [Histidinibacterium aquaticum]KAA9007105.1 peroxiredoxin [Histidinibacterium aquaticum]